MYDELVKDLREISGNRAIPICMAETAKQAADAIEDLSVVVRAQKAVLDKFPCWISVTERLPEQKINQNTLDFEYVLCATTFGDVRPYKFGRRIGQGESHFWNGAGYVDTYVTHWMPLPEQPKEE